MQKGLRPTVRCSRRTRNRARSAVRSTHLSRAPLILLECVFAADLLYVMPIPRLPAVRLCVSRSAPRAIRVAHAAAGRKLEPVPAKSRHGGGCRAITAEGPLQGRAAPWSVVRRCRLGTRAPLNDGSVLKCFQGIAGGSWPNDRGGVFSASPRRRPGSRTADVITVR